MKPKQILDLEKYWGIEIDEYEFRLNENGEIIFLNLMGKNIIKLSPLSDLTGLIELNLRHNQIIDLSPLSGLSALTDLDLQNNQIIKLGPLSNLTGLIVLNLADNQITDLSPLSCLYGLMGLLLWNNQISDLSPLLELRGLRKLDLSSNQIIDVSQDFVLQGFELFYDYSLWKIESDKFINLYNNNPLQNPPKEIILEGMDAVRTWYAAKQETEQSGETLKTLDEVRVIILGEGKVGKTTLKKRLLGLEIPETETETDGIDISIYKPKDWQGISLRLWDFGGQEIQHSVHKLFLEENCVYILVLDKRQDQQTNGTLSYWLNHIRSFGKNAPILIVENQIDASQNLQINEHTSPEEIANLVQLNGQIKEAYFKEDSPIDFVGISAKKGYNFETFKEKLKTLARQQNNQGNYSKDWLNAKNEVESQITGGTESGLARHNYISKETFDLVCKQAGVAEDANKAILGIMLRLGVAFYFKSKENRPDLIIMNPEWITVGIYSLILNKKVQELNGRLLKSDLQNILIQQAENQTFFSQKKNYRFEPDELDYILGLMQDYELCYTPDDVEYFLPMGFKQNYTSDFIKNPSEVTAFFFEYDTLPTAIWYKFLVRLFKRKIVSRYWDYGIEVKSQTATGLVEFLTINQKKIKIWIAGEGSIELLTLLRYELDFINEEFSNITVTPKVYTEDGREIAYFEAIMAIGQKQTIITDYYTYLPKELIKKVEPFEKTLQNLYRDLLKTKLNKSEIEKILQNVATELSENPNKPIIVNINQVNPSITVSPIITVNTETRLELPKESNALEGKLNFLREELDKKQADEALKIAELLDVLAKLRETPTKEEAVKKGLLERFKRLGEWLKTGNDVAKTGEEILGKVDWSQVHQWIEQVQQTIQ